MDLHLHFGAGPNQLPDPWQNLGPAHDIRKRLKFESGSTAAILAEHVVEHVPFLQGLGFFRECLRVLRPGGVLRVAFPDVRRFIASFSGELEFATTALTYANALADRPAVDLPEAPASRARAAIELLLTGWGHQSAWTEETAAAALLVAGFPDVRRRQYGCGALGAHDGHHLDVGVELALLESTILEARK